ncbi:Low-molecular weight cobalt-containing nitrile hydratase subunit beta [Paraburkholderia domus]|jgi:nitrile hydratase, beta subunit|uniref:Nitrile hydratase subunit beta n=1 Tax=Paraburkholderia domus TaxID=2793075 RepID=A0A9N8R3S3_9BURK|nr:nitrile hydratase subunit beta [Paraburkholderia domus]MBK5054012.1 nitrile hydratase subunit beta [Burkholderia sp. R-70006]MBK5064417.1 nitrile hydratase subunit beta [Burkholderia sp. R-70199]MBK5090218.1 nitrile hydratase subunit beta [Burkholderia sp. R-69927]MBK5122430.1 nitrile hydratase subunit beta [Burkholderia sp. R-69980]MBK5168390.1 nitrile hydratase subunit beta [Burkholderia sp. R-70211]MBK5183794.1 nitrile hydratase subunit beta [Burkholderia sp. R-69749]MCI0149302.1 nitri
MNGAQDLGGMQSFGPIHPGADSLIFHADWERRALAITLAMGAVGKWNIDMSRAARESLPPAQYLASSYFEIWLEGLQKLLLNAGLATAEEIGSGKSMNAAAPVSRVLMAHEVAAALRRGNPAVRVVAANARFKVGEEVLTRQLNPSTHCRLPRYCRGRRGRIVAVHGAHVFPDTNAIGLGEQPQWLYTVQFDASELWGADTTAASVCVDCWESYLDYPGGAPV